MSVNRITLTVMGFDQAGAVALGLSLEQLAVLRWFLTFSGKGRMLTEAIEGREFYWVCYGAVAKALPILRGASEKHISRLLNGLVRADVLLKRPIRRGPGTRVYFAPTERVLELETRVVSGQDSPLRGSRADRIVRSQRTGQSAHERTGLSANSSVSDSVVSDSLYKSSGLPCVQEEDVARGLIGEKQTLTDLLRRPEQREAFTKVAANVLRSHGESVLRAALGKVAAEWVTKRGSGGQIKRPAAYLLRTVQNLVAGV